MLLDRAIPVHVTGLYIFTVLNLIALFHITTVGCDVTVDDFQNRTRDIFQDMPANFGPQFPEEGLRGFLYYVTPHNGCGEVSPPPRNLSSQIWIALMSRNYSCDFAVKMINAQKAGYQGAIVFNNKGDDSVFSMAAGKLGYKVNIPSALVGYTDGICLQNYQFNLREMERYTVMVDNRIPFDFDKYLIPFAVVVGTCFILMIVFMIGKWCRDIHKKRKSRLSKTNLKKIPVKKFKKGDEYDVCAICLDDYEEGEKLRVLPCSHAYHCKCIDPWLTKQKRTCPVCKRRVMPRTSQDSDTDSDEENGNSEDTERTPLLAGNHGNIDPTRRSTFENSGLPQLANTDVVTVVVRRSRDEDSDSTESEEGAAGRLPWTKSISKSPKELQEMGTSNGGYEGVSTETDSDDIEDETSPEPLDVSDPDVVVVTSQGTNEDQSHVV